MDKKTIQKKVFKRNKDGKYKTKKRVQSKMLYNQKFKVPLRKKRKNEYDADEEAR